VANKTIIMHHSLADDRNISHKDPKVVDSILEEIRIAYGKEAPMKESHGKIHDYLGMNLDFTVKGKVSITMFDYIKNMLNELPIDMAEVAVMPVATHLFEVSDSGVKLKASEAELFHHNVAKLLFL